MNIVDRIKNIVYRRQRALFGVAIFSVFIAVSFRIDGTGYVWLWSSYPFIAFLLVIFSLGLVLIWVRVEQSKIQATIEEIKKMSDAHEKKGRLSNRQMEVFDLIAEGKSNKEITQKLHIELSTLKTHINNIYRLLEIKNRNELRNMAGKKS